MKVHPYIQFALLPRKHNHLSDITMTLRLTQISNQILIISCNIIINSIYHIYSCMHFRIWKPIMAPKDVSNSHLTFCEKSQCLGRGNNRDEDSKEASINLLPMNTGKVPTITIIHKGWYLWTFLLKVTGLHDLQWLHHK